METILYEVGDMIILDKPISTGASAGFSGGNRAYITISPGKHRITDVDYYHEDAVNQQNRLTIIKLDDVNWWIGADEVRPVNPEAMKARVKKVDVEYEKWK